MRMGAGLKRNMSMITIRANGFVNAGMLSCSLNMKPITLIDQRTLNTDATSMICCSDR